MATDIFLRKETELRRWLQQGAGCRIGEAAVCSRRVHTIDPYRPEVVSILQDADAGRVFYRRQKADEIVHLDIFHSVQALDPRPIAQAVKKGIDRYSQEVAPSIGWEQSARLHRLAHFIDVQTGAGGGRVTGRLCFGQKESVKKAHLNHVHIAAQLRDRQLAAILFVSWAVEQAIIQQGAELRRIEALGHETTRLGQRGDLHPYTTFTDSFLRGRSQRELAADEAYGYQLTAIADVLENLDSLEELGAILTEVQSRGRPPFRSESACYPREARLFDAWIKLEGYGYVERHAGRYRLTEEGMELNRHLITRARELEAELRKQGLLFSLGVGGEVEGSFGDLSRQQVTRRGNTRRIIRPGEGDSIALAETVGSALVRQQSEGQPGLRIIPDDLHFESRLQRKGIDICLLIDASASMLGKRIKAAKNLAEHLVINSRDRIAVITFQEDAVEVVVPFTRNHLLIRQSLQTIKPGGLTPLAKGLRVASELIQTRGQRQGLLLLITDGIPTLGENSPDPLRDSLDAALDFRQQTRFRLCCIGLQPNRSILKRLVETAEGSLHVIDELNAQSMLRIARSERNQTLASD